MSGSPEHRTRRSEKSKRHISGSSEHRIRTFQSQTSDEFLDLRVFGTSDRTFESKTSEASSDLWNIGPNIGEQEF
eukprot:10811374-Karenia_brevis.AAC.1